MRLRSNTATLSSTRSATSTLGRADETLSGKNSENRELMKRPSGRSWLAKERSFDALNQGVGFEGLAQDTKRACFQGGALETIFESRTDHDHGYCAGIIVQSLLELNPAQSRHEDVGDDALACLLRPGIEK